MSEVQTSSGSEAQEIEIFDKAGFGVTMLYRLQKSNGTLTLTTRKLIFGKQLSPTTTVDLSKYWSVTVSDGETLANHGLRWGVLIVLTFGAALVAPQLVGATQRMPSAKFWARADSDVYPWLVEFHQIKALDQFVDALETLTDLEIEQE